MSDIALTSSMRRNLLSLQNTQMLQDMTTDRLSTGRKVNSALDNPSSFFTAQGLTNRSKDLSALLDSMGQGIQTIKAAEKGMDTLTDLVDQAKAVADEAFENAAAAANSAERTFDLSGTGTQTVTLTGLQTGTTLGVNNTDNPSDIKLVGENGTSYTFETAIAATGQDLADFINNEVANVAASFDGGGDMVITNSTGEAFDIQEVTNGATELAGPVVTLIDGNDIPPASLNTTSRILASGDSPRDISITTESGTTKIAVDNTTTISDLVDEINANAPGVSASMAGGELSIKSDGGLTIEGLNGSVLETVFGSAPDGFNSGSTMTLDLKLTDSFNLSGGEKLTVGGTSIDLASATNGGDVFALISSALGSDYDVGTTSKGQIEISYIGSGQSDIAVEFANQSTAEQLALNDGSISTGFSGVMSVGQTADNEELVSQFNNLLSQIDSATKDADYKGINLLNGSNLTINFNEDRTSSISLKGVTFDAKGLGLDQASGWKSTTDIQGALDQARDAIDTLRSQAAKFGRDAAVIQTREDFTTNMINTLQEGADKLTLADMNEEGANMLALQTRQQLATNSLSMASQAAQSVMSLFR